MSINPGITVFPRALSCVTPRGVAMAPAGPMAVIFPPSTTITASTMGARPVPSMTSKAWMTSGPTAWEGVEAQLAWRGPPQEVLLPLYERQLDARLLPGLYRGLSAVRP